MNMKILLLKTPYEVQQLLASQARKRRKTLQLTQQQLADRSGVSLGSVKRFEQSGEISLSSLLKIAMVLDCLNEFAELFVKKEYNSIEEVINERNQ